MDMHPDPDAVNPDPPHRLQKFKSFKSFKSFSEFFFASGPGFRKPNETRSRRILIKTAAQYNEQTVQHRVVDAHHVNADPDPSFHCNADPDPNPAFHYNANPDPAPHQTDVNQRPLG